MPKASHHIKTLLQSFRNEELVDLCHNFAKKHKDFEAFIVENASETVATHKSLGEWQEDLAAILKKGMGRSKKVRITRLEKAGLKAFAQMSESNLSKGNLQDALIMNLALIEGLLSIVIAHDGGRWATPLSKRLVKYLFEAKDRFDSSIKLANPQRQKRQPILRALYRIWLNQAHSLQLAEEVLTAQELMGYAPNDEDQIYLQLIIKESMPGITKEYNRKKSHSGWKYFIPGQFDKEHPVGKKYQQIQTLKEELQNMTKV
jgi:hypothetical protein